MKKSLLATMIAGSLMLVGCGSEEAPKPVKPVEKEAVVKKADSEKTEAPKKAVDVVKTELKKPPMASKEIEEAKSALIKEVKGSADKLRALIASEKEKGLVFIEKSKEEVEKLVGMKAKEYEMQLKEFKDAFGKLEVFVSDKYVDTKKQSFYISDFSVVSGLSSAEVEFDDKSKESYFVIKGEKGWEVYETKAEKAEREKKLQAYLAELRKKAAKAEKKDEAKK